jgi:hypothetical protein
VNATTVSNVLAGRRKSRNVLNAAKRLLAAHRHAAQGSAA